MKKLILLGALCFAIPVFSAPKVVIGVFTRESEAAFREKTMPVFVRFAAGGNVELRNLTPYDEKGEYKADQLVSAVKGVPDDVQLLFFDWNERYSEKRHDELIAAMAEQTRKSRPIVAAAGVPSNNEGSCPLTKTLMGRVPESLIIGELAERDRLLPQCYFGPEMLSAIRPPKDLMGQGYAPLLFVTRWGSQWSKRSAQEWLDHLRGRKARSKKLWTALEDFFPR